MSLLESLLNVIPGAIEIRNSLPRPTWEAIAAWVESNTVSSAQNEIWTEIANDWMRHLQAALPPGYIVHESAEFILLGKDAAISKQIVKWCEIARKTILEALDGVAVDDGYGKHVVLSFSNIDTYYDYISDFYPDDGEFALSGGMFFNTGYGHFAICPTSGYEYERPISHELTHVLLRHLPLPLWLNEGVSQFMEDVVSGTSYFRIDHEGRQRHHDYWNADTIHSFWSGESFYSADEGQQLSYELSQVLFRNLLSDYPGKMKEILRAASYVDAGNAAIVKVCKKSLDDRVGQFLGKGTWSPRSNYTDEPEP